MNRLIRYFLPFFVAFYFIVSLVPVLLKSENEQVPFFSFKLYSRVPNGFEQYDILLEESGGSTTFLLHHNKDLTKPEKKRLLRQFRTYSKTQHQELLEHPIIEQWISRYDSAQLVRLEGDYIEAVASNAMTVHPIKTLK